MNLKRKIFLIFGLIALLLVALFGAVSDYSNDTKQIQNIELVQKKLVQLKYLDEIITQLQKERGLSAIYYENRSKKYAQALEMQRKKTEATIKKASKYLDTKELSLKRQEAIKVVNSTKSLRFEAFMNYTKLIKSLLYQSKLLIFKTQNSDIKNSLLNYSSLNVMQETVGQLRGLIGAILTTKSISKEEYDEIIILNRIFEEHYQEFKEYSSQKFFFDKRSFNSFLSTVATITSITSLDDKSIQEIQMSPLQWFNIASNSVDAVRDGIVQEMTYVNKIVSASMDEAQKIATRHLILSSLGVFIMLTIVVVAWILAKKLIAEQKLLKNYKNVIDNNPSSIVSKTDKYGNITYVNDSFCQLSQYTREELIGKPHNIIRHKDVEKDTFKDLWKTIKSGKVWSGIVKNKAKDDTPYWVDASISPIYDNNGELIEYIAMRHDITDMILQNEEVERTQREFIYRMGESVESRSKESGNHIRRVAHYSKTLALLYGLSEEESETLFIASTVHDMGKIAIPDSILLKPGKLDKDEFEIMKTHAEIGYKLLSGSNLPILQMAATIAREHHEHFNGNGYPQGIKDQEISIHAKIVAIVDVFDALVSERVYKKAWELEKVLELLESESGKQFDPLLVKLFLENIEEFIKIKEQHDK